MPKAGKKPCPSEEKWLQAVPKGLQSGIVLGARRGEGQTRTRARLPSTLSVGVGPSPSQPFPKAAPRSPAQMENLQGGGGDARTEPSPRCLCRHPATDTRDGRALGRNAGKMAAPLQRWKPHRQGCGPALGGDCLPALLRQPKCPVPPSLHPRCHAVFQHPLQLPPGSRPISWPQVRGLKAF